MLRFISAEILFIYRSNMLWLLINIADILLIIYIELCFVWFDIWLRDIK